MEVEGLDDEDEGEEWSDDEELFDPGEWDEDL